MSVDSSQFNLVEYFPGFESLRQVGDRVAVEFQGNQISYRELRSKVDHWARAIANQGVKEGERVALLLYDSPEFIASFLATVSIGAVCVPINTFLPAHDVEFILADSGARLLILESELEDKLNLSGESASGYAVVNVDTLTRDCSALGDDGVKKAEAGGDDSQDSSVFALHFG